MLMCSIDLRTAPGPWHWDGERAGWRRGTDQIRPLAHPALEARAVTGGHRTLMVVRERAAGQPTLLQSSRPAPVDAASYERALAECRAWPLQSIWIEADTGGAAGVRLSTGLGGVAPLYLAHAKGRLAGSWQYMDLRPHLGAGVLDEKEVTRLLTGRTRYGHDTLFTTVKLLTERSTAYADAHGLHLAYPKAAEHAAPSELAPGVDGDALAVAYEQVSDHVLARRFLDPARTAAQLSGGMDSTNLAISLALQHPGAITPCAMLVGGVAGAQQITRRRTVIERFDFAADVIVSAADHPPLSPGGLRRARPEAISPLDEPHLEAADALAQALRARHLHTVVAGFGGDEVARSRARTGDRDPLAVPDVPAWCGARVRDLTGSVNQGVAPPTVAPETALVALSVATPYLARRGLWTIAPFTDPDMVRFGQRLPLQWKKDKALLHHRLAIRGLPEEVVNPRRRENFAHLMNRSVHEYATGLLRSWGPALHLVEQGFVDAAALNATVERASLGEADAAPYRTGLFLITAIELALRAL
ncbi:hypothetical protein [Streptomyces sp. NRRL S-1521]|uniref:hypothetical protein n=1 Tax=Streptomyces sp. NRRL S-1521 TaxID=1609100 RepID=UPI00074A9EBC|nr:hypothetical protein [Streptomyces sp. NRRL S-1521]KUL48987.1 hypothetical protein ADL30_34530 [Streptomyces sp. NRRL S-1521]